MTPALLCAGLEVGLNRYLALEPEVLAECAKLDGRVVALHVPELDWSIHLQFHRGGLRVAAAVEETPEVTVTGPLRVLLRLIAQQARGEERLPAGLKVQGDVELLSRLQHMLARVGFDPEELAAHYLGDAAAHRLIGAARQFLGWGRRSADTLALDTAEYLREETRDLVHRADVEAWMDEVDRVRDGVDRLAARLSRLKQKQATAA